MIKDVMVLAERESVRRGALGSWRRDSPAVRESRYWVVPQRVAFARSGDGGCRRACHSRVDRAGARGGRRDGGEAGQAARALAAAR